MLKKSFDQYAEKYDSWFLDNQNVLNSEVRLVAHFLKNHGDVFSIGCGSGLFEMILEKEYDISIKNGIEPSKDMAEIARKRGLNVEVTCAEDVDFKDKMYDTILFNGTPSYISDLRKAFSNSYNALRKGGKVIVIDVPKESSYGILYNLAKLAGTWDHSLLHATYPRDPYPIEFVNIANWRTTTEKIELLTELGFSDLEFAQTLTKHPIYSNSMIEDPVPGYDSGDYVAICAYKK